MRLRLAVILAGVVLVSGCLHAAQDSESFAEVVSQRDNSSYHVAYDADIGRNDSLSYESQVRSMDLYRSGGDRKNVVNVGIFDTDVAYFESGDILVRCSEWNADLSEANGSGIGVNCEEQGNYPWYTFERYFNTVNYSKMDSKGYRNIAGRECGLYRGNISLKHFNSFYTDKGGLTMCIDLEKGYPALMRLELVEEDRTPVDIRASNYTSSFDRSMVGPTVNAVAKISCNHLKARVISVKDLGEVEVSINGNNRALEMEAGNKYSFDPEPSNSSKYRIEVRAEEETYSDVCYDISAGSLRE